MKVLFVQENPILPTALSLTLMAKGFSLIFSSRSKNYLFQVEHENPAVIILDLANPNWCSYLAEAKKDQSQ